MDARLICFSAVVGALLGSAAAAQQPAGDAQAGEKIFRKCRACHTVAEGQNRVGPHLFGILGRPVASVEGFDYSDPMRAWAEGKTWDAALLGTWLEDPRGVVKGTRMTFAGLRDAQDRADVIAYLRSVAE